MAGDLGSWGDPTFTNVISLLSKSPAWKQYTQSKLGASDWKPSAGAFGPVGNDLSEEAKLGFSGAISFPGIKDFSAGSESSDSSGLTQPSLPDQAVPSSLYTDASALMRQNYDLANQYATKTAGLQQGYAAQLQQYAKDLRGLDLANSMIALQAKENSPSAVAARGAVAQSQMATAGATEDARLKAVGDVAYQMAMANKIPRMGYSA